MSREQRKKRFNFFMFKQTFKWNFCDSVCTIFMADFPLRRRKKAEEEVWKSSPTQFDSHSCERLGWAYFKRAQISFDSLIPRISPSSLLGVWLLSGAPRSEREQHKYQLPRMIKIPLNDTISRMINYRFRSGVEVGVCVLCDYTCLHKYYAKCDLH